MGVLGLWQLLQPSSRPTKLQALEGKKLAIDISIWLHQATKGVRNSSNGHLSVLYNRICKLLYFKVKPIFVFDGPNVPKLKERVLRERQKRRNEAAEKSSELQNRIEKNILKAYALKNAALPNNQNLPKEKNVLISSKSSTSIHSEIAADDDLFKLPNEEPRFINQDSDEILTHESADIKDVFLTMQNIDQEIFDNLPPEIQIEYLSNYKEALKSKKSQDFEEFPQESMDFSQYQIKSLLQKNEVSTKITNLKNTIKSTILMDTGFENVFQQKIASEDDREIILFTKKESKFALKSQLDNILSSQKSEHENLNDETKNSSIKKQDSKTNLNDSNESITYSIEFDTNNKLELVPTKKKIEEDKTEIYIKKYQVNERDEIKQIEINEPEVSTLLKTQKAEKFLNKLNDDEECIIVSEFKEKQTHKEETFLNIDDSDSDDDFVEVEPQIAEMDVKINRDIDLIEQVNEEIMQRQSKIQIQLFDIETDKNSSVESIIKSKNSDQIETEIENDEIVELTLTDNKEKEIQNQVRPSTSSQMNQSIDFEEYNEQLLRENRQLISEKQNFQRLSNPIEQSIVDEAKYLLRLFGLPYVESPGEAEAQCAYLDYTNQTDGSITEDSDVWLFGAKKVYKNFFSHEQLIDMYDDNVIKSQLGLDRDSLICVAMLVGSDYTEGVEQIGIVKAVEILQEFEGVGIEKLQNLKKWSESDKTGQKLNKTRKSLLKIKLPNSFPSEIVYNAYINPDLDKGKDEFKWSMPDLNLIRKFLTKKMNWPNKKIDDDLLPVIKRLNDSKIQKTIESFFAYETTSSFNKQSKRMINAINLFKNKNNNEKEKSNLPSSQSDFNLSENEDEILDDNAKIANKKSSLQSKSKKNNKKSKSLVEEEIIVLETDQQKSSSSPKKRKSSESFVSNIQTEESNRKNKPKIKIVKRK